LPRLGVAVLAVGLGAFAARPAFAEPPTFNNREPRTPRQRAPHAPHAPHAAHKPPLEFAPVHSDHPVHKNPARPQRVIIEHAPRPAHVHYTPARLQIKHTVTFPVHKPHVEVRVGQVNRVLPQHKPRSVQPHTKTSIEHNKPKVTQPQIIKIVN